MGLERSVELRESLCSLLESESAWLRCLRSVGPWTFFAARLLAQLLAAAPLHRRLLPLLPKLSPTAALQGDQHALQGMLQLLAQWAHECPPAAEAI